MSDFINTIDALGDDIVIDSIIDRTITEFKDNQLTNIGHSAFRSCAALETVDLPSATTTDYYAFAGCTALANVNLPLIDKAHQYCFMDCTSLQEIVLPAAVDLNNGAFTKCSALKKIDTSIARNIRTNALVGCDALTALILRNEAAVCSLSSALGASIANGTGYIYVPRALVDSYKAATNWSTFATQFRALEDYTVDGTITGELDESKI